jgi:hypothetical protein
MWRLGATRAAANTVVKAMITVPTFDCLSQLVRRVHAPETADMTLDSSYTTPHDVLRSVFPESKSQNPLQMRQASARMNQLDPPLARPISNKMAAREIIVTRVRAELQIADKFSRVKDMKFVDNDLHIGCRKPVCYFCYKWLCNHRHRYVPPATHHKSFQVVVDQMAVSTRPERM